MNDIRIIYSFRFGDGSSKDFKVLLDGSTLLMSPCALPEPPEWTELAGERCGDCALTGEATHCPVALNLSGVAEAFGERLSYEVVDVSVLTEARTYAKTAPLQDGLSSLVGVIMASSGCPTMEPLKPMVRFHLPFAAIDETIFRMVSMFLMAQFLLKIKGMPHDLGLQGLADIYAPVGRLNRDFAKRLKRAAKKDANLNALVKLDCFAKLVPKMAEDTVLKEFERSFSFYFRE